MGKVGVIVVLVFLLLGVFADPINDGIKGWRTDTTTQSFSVTTAAGQTTANVTLSGDLFQDNITNVSTITSNVTAETPIATSYTTATNVLLLSALNAAAMHTITLTYFAETSNTVLQTIGPWLSLLIIGGLLVGIFVSGGIGRKHRR